MLVHVNTGQSSLRQPPHKSGLVRALRRQQGKAEFHHDVLGGRDSGAGPVQCCPLPALSIRLEHLDLGQSSSSQDGVQGDDGDCVRLGFSWRMAFWRLHPALSAPMPSVGLLTPRMHTDMSMSTGCVTFVWNRASCIIAGHNVQFKANSLTAHQRVNVNKTVHVRGCHLSGDWGQPHLHHVASAIHTLPIAAKTRGYYVRLAPLLRRPGQVCCSSHSILPSLR